MRTAEAPGRHLSAEEIVDRVFPSNEGPIPVPLHLAACPDCQARVAGVRESWLMDRGAVTGAVEALPPAFWEAQSQSILQVITSEPARDAVSPFPLLPASFSKSFFRRPVLAFGSLAAALALVAAISFSRTNHVTIGQQKAVPPTAVPASVERQAEQDKQDDELLRTVDSLLDEDPPLTSLLPQEAS